MKDKIREILVKHSDNKNANDRIEAELLDLFSVRLSFDELKDEILKHKVKSEYKQASIIILRNIFEEN